MQTDEIIQILSECRPLANKLLAPGVLYTYQVSEAEISLLKHFEQLYNLVSAAQLKLLASEALLTQIELLYLLDFYALVRLEGRLD